MSTFPAYRPIAEFVKGRLKTNSEGVSPTQKVAWLRVAASAEPGLVLYSNPSQSTFHTGSDDMHQTAYGRGDFGGTVGDTWGGEPVNTDSTPGRGLRPRPLIDSVTLKNGAGGMTRTCEFNINCYTLEQMEIVAQHFQEPGYTCMIEFGWNVEESITQLTPLDTNSVAALNAYTSAGLTIDMSAAVNPGVAGAIVNFTESGGVAGVDNDNVVSKVIEVFDGEILR